MKTKTIQAYSDPGHAWAKVPLSDLLRLGIVGDISSFSYISTSSDINKPSQVFLELTIYVEAMRLNGVNVKFKTNHSNRQSRIRGYARFDGKSLMDSYDRAKNRIDELFNYARGN